MVEEREGLETFQLSLCVTNYPKTWWLIKYSPFYYDDELYGLRIRTGHNRNG